MIVKITRFCVLLDTVFVFEFVRFFELNHTVLCTKSHSFVSKIMRFYMPNHVCVLNHIFFFLAKITRFCVLNDTVYINRDPGFHFERN